MDDEKFVIMFRSQQDPERPIRAIGTFDSQEDADEYAAEFLRMERGWWVLKVEQP